MMPAWTRFTAALESHLSDRDIIPVKMYLSGGAFIGYDPHGAGCSPLADGKCKRCPRAYEGIGSLGTGWRCAQG